MTLIKTAGKERLPKGFSYPIGAEALSVALKGIPQYDNAVLWFTWRDEFWVSRWRKRLEGREPIMMLRVAYSEYFGRWDVHVYSVPSENTIFAREQLRAELPTLRAKLLLPKAPKSISITLSLHDADRAANPAHALDAAMSSSLHFGRHRRRASDVRCSLKQRTL